MAIGRGHLRKPSSDLPRGRSAAESRHYDGRREVRLWATSRHSANIAGRAMRTSEENLNDLAAGPVLQEPFDDPEHPRRSLQKFRERAAKRGRSRPRQPQML
jgi:hypothetical protein